MAGISSDSAFINNIGGFGLQLSTDVIGLLGFLVCLLVVGPAVVVPERPSGGVLLLVLIGIL